MKLFKAIKLGYKVLKDIQKNKEEKPIFGDDPKTYGVENLTEKRQREHPKGEKTTRIRTVFPKEGGIFTHIEGNKYPFPGLPDKDVVLDIGTLKRMVPAAINAYYPFLQKHVLDPKKYCKSVREVYRLFDILIEREENKEHHGERWRKVRDMVCVIMEYDNAYRFRAQDIAPEVNKEELKLDEGDRHWASRTTSYKWGFLGKKSKEEPRKKPN